jgi:glycosyltransferase involved in cell wall biosynthesis
VDVALRRPFHHGYFVAPAGRALVTRLAADAVPDVVVAGTLYTLPYLEAGLRGRCVLDTQNAEALRLAAMAATKSSARAAAAALQLGPVRRHERTQVESVARVLAVSAAEQRYFESLAPGRVDLVPNGVDCAALRRRDDQPAEPVILFLGSLDYGANVDALRVLVEEVVPRLGTTGASLLVVGSNPRPAVRRLLARSSRPAELVANAPSVEEQFLRARVLAVPLRFGGGTRLKILEALARGVPVVSTPVGCEGLDVEPGAELLVAPDPARFAAALDRVLADGELAGRLAAAGRRLVERAYDWRAIGDAFVRSLTRAAADAPLRSAEPRRVSSRPSRPSPGGRSR